MNLHGQIMNIVCVTPGTFPLSANMAYRTGHRDARHAAAELANEADAEIAKLRTERDELARMLAEALTVVQSASSRTASVDDRLCAICDKITSAMLAVSVGVKT